MEMYKYICILNDLCLEFNYEHCIRKSELNRKYIFSKCEFRNLLEVFYLKKYDFGFNPDEIINKWIENVN